MDQFGLFLLLWRLLWTFIYKSLSVHFHSSWVYSLEWNCWSDHMITLCLTFWRTARLFSKAVVPFYFITSRVWVPIPPRLHQRLLLSDFLFIAVLAGMRRHFLWFWFAFSILYSWLVIVSILSSLLIKCMFSLKKCLSRPFAHF